MPVLSRVLSRLVHPRSSPCHPRRTAPTELEGGEMNDGNCRARRRHEQSSRYIHVGRETADNSDEDGELTDPVRRASSRRTEPPDMPEGVRVGEAERHRGLGVQHTPESTGDGDVPGTAGMSYHHPPLFSMPDEQLRVRDDTKQPNDARQSSAHGTIRDSGVVQTVSDTQVVLAHTVTPCPARGSSPPVSKTSHQT